MSLKNPQLSNESLLVIGAGISFLFFLTGLAALTNVPLWLLNYPAWLLLIGGAVLLAETWLEGKKPNLRKEIAPIIQTAMSVIALVFAAVLFAGVTVPTAFAGILGFVYILIAVMIIREVIFD